MVGFAMPSVTSALNSNGTRTSMGAPDFPASSKDL